MSLGYAKSITRHNRISYGGTPSSLTHLQSPSQSLFHSHSHSPFSIPFPFPVSVVLEFFNLICSTDFRSFKTCFCYCFLCCSSICMCGCVGVSVFVFILLLLLLLLLMLLSLRVALVVANLSHFYFDFALIFRTAAALGATKMSPVQACFSCLSC